ncbi:AAA family ATPase [Mycolicibacterium septicum]|nr:AAA family ATPase [Mycolicibacterium septicum]
MFKIEVRGFKRLSNVSCNVDGRMIAFLGPNEAGKSSVLQALSWLSESNTALPLRDATRGQDLNPHEPVVRVHYRLDKEDIAAIADLPMTLAPKALTVAKHADGDTRYELEPLPSRESAPFVEALASLDSLTATFPGEFESDDSSIADEEVGRLLGTVRACFENPDAAWDGGWDEDFNTLVSWLNEPIKSDGLADPQPRALETAGLLVKARGLLGAAHPEAIARQRLRARTSVRPL